MKDDREAAIEPNGLESASLLSEASVRQMLDRGDARAAAQATLDLYGAEVFGFLARVLEHQSSARNAYVGFAERVGRGIDRFRWYCALRIWAYTLASRELERRRTAGSRHAPSPSPSDVDWPSAADAASSIARSISLQGLRTDVAALRSELTEEERELLILRVSRKLSWREIALVTLGDVAEEALEREGVSLRRRFVSIREQLTRAVVSQRVNGRVGNVDGNSEGTEDDRIVKLRRP